MDECKRGKGQRHAKQMKEAVTIRQSVMGAHTAIPPQEFSFKSKWAKRWETWNGMKITCVRCNGKWKLMELCKGVASGKKQAKEKDHFFSLLKGWGLSRGREKEVAIIKLWVDDLLNVWCVWLRWGRSRPKDVAGGHNCSWIEKPQASDRNPAVPLDVYVLYWILLVEGVGDKRCLVYSFAFPGPMPCRKNLQNLHIMSI